METGFFSVDLLAFGRCMSITNHGKGATNTFPKLVWLQNSFGKENLVGVIIRWAFFGKYWNEPPRNLTGSGALLLTGDVSYMYFLYIVTWHDWCGLMKAILDLRFLTNIQPRTG